MTLGMAERIASILMNENGLVQDGWTFGFTNRKNELGVCSYDRKQIALSKHHVLEDTFDDVKDTILHEIAHALTPGHGHDEVWKEKAKEIGCNANRCKESRIKTKYTAQCPVCGYQYQAHRRRAGSCGRCSDTYDERFQWLWILNK